MNPLPPDPLVNLNLSGRGSPPVRLARLAPLFLSLLLAGSPPALAAEPAHVPNAQPTPAQIKEARELFNAARNDEDALRWADALEKLLKVAAVKRTAGVRYHIAICEEKLGQIAAALAHYGEALDAARQEHSADVEDLLQDPFLPELRARVPQLTLAVPLDAPDAELRLDEVVVPASSWGVALSVNPGPHHVEALATGRRPFSTRIVLHEREVTVLEIPLRPIASLPAAPSAALSATPPPAIEPSRAQRRSILFPIVAGVGAAVLGGGGVGAYASAGSAQSYGRAECPTRTNCDSLKAPVHTWDDVALGAWVGAGVLATVAVVLWALPAKSADVRLTAGPMLVRLEGSF